MKMIWHMTSLALFLLLGLSMSSHSLQSRSNESINNWNEIEVNFTSMNRVDYSEMGHDAANIMAEIIRVARNPSPSIPWEMFDEAQLAGNEEFEYHRSRRTRRDNPLVDRLTILNQQAFTIPPRFQDRDNSIQVLSYTRSHRDGPVDGWYLMTNHQTVELSVDYAEHEHDVGQWMMYGGSADKICLINRVFGNGYRAHVACEKGGTYFAFYRTVVTLDPAQCSRSNPPSATDICVDHTNPTCGGYCYKTKDEVKSKTLYIEYVSNSLQPVSTAQYKSYLENTFYSDPIKIVSDVLCYRWAYRLILQNEVGFVFNDAAAATDGTYRVYELKVWIVDPDYVTIVELEGGTDALEPNTYSQVTTLRFHELGVTPCIRKAHTSVEITTEAEFRLTDADDRNIAVNERLLGPHWKFLLKVYLDRVVSTLSDIELTITPRQHSATYGCFVADVRVVIPCRKFTFLRAAREDLSHIHLYYSKLPEVRKRFVEENVISYFGEPTIYIGPSWNRGHDLSDVRTDVVVFPNPCLSLEFAFAYKGTLVVTEDGLSGDELKRITLPNFFENALALQRKILNLSPAQEDAQKDKLNRDTITDRQDIVDLVFTPVNIVLLTKHAALYFHPTNLGLKGIGFTTLSEKYRLGALVRRKWCATTASPKSHNLWVPAFSRYSGSIVLIYSIPVEGTLIINRPTHFPGCVPIKDTTAERGKRYTFEKANETQIHSDEVADTIQDAVSERKRRSKYTERKEREKASMYQEKPKPNLDNERVFWTTGGRLLDLEDKHFARGATDPANVRIGTNNTEFNKHVIFHIDSDFEKMRKCLQDNGMTFDMDEVIYKDPEQTGTGGESIERDSPNHKMFNIHGLEFSAVEKRYLISIGFQSNEFRKDLDQKRLNSVIVIVSTINCLDLPVVVTDTTSDEVELERVTIAFSGSILRRNDVESEFVKRARIFGFNETTAYTARLDDYTYKGKYVRPAPLSKYTASMNTMNTANPIYIIRINDILIYASLDGSFAKPILSYDLNPTQTDFTIASAFMPFQFFDVIVTEVGIISVLSRRSENVPENEAFIGSVLSNEPLRFVHPFLPSQIPMQAVNPEGEVAYGVVSSTFGDGLDDVRSAGTEVIDIPFWSLFKGSVGYTAGENTVELDIAKHDVDSEASANKDATCPYAYFNVEYIAYPYVECLYHTRITTEIAFYGDLIPLEADIVIEFSEVQGISVVIAQYLEVDFDQTIIRKTIDLESSMTVPILHEIFRRHVTSEDDDPIREKVRVFTLTVRSSILNLQCEKRDYFKTIQMNIGKTFSFSQ